MCNEGAWCGFFQKIRYFSVIFESQVRGIDKRVSIPIGFSNALRQQQQSSLWANWDGFNPYWVFQCAATCPAHSDGNGTMSFNPYWVFQCAATTVSVRGNSTQKKFQSLLGFPMRCDVLYIFKLIAGFICFNPYWVFQCAATFLTIVAIVAKYCFNPYWVFQCAATYIRSRAGSRKRIVSIPIGFSNALRLARTLVVIVVTLVFQSLLGFPMRCDNKKYK